MRQDLLEGVRTLQWSGRHPSHASGITDTLTDTTTGDAPRRTLSQVHELAGELFDPQPLS
jgi:hypothetical protein